MMLELGRSITSRREGREVIERRLVSLDGEC
jgi:hypothetical protein